MVIRFRLMTALLGSYWSSVEDRTWFKKKKQNILLASQIFPIYLVSVKTFCPLLVNLFLQYVCLAIFMEERKKEFLQSLPLV